MRQLASATSPPFVCAVNVEEIWRGARAAEEEAIARMLVGLRIAPLGEREGRVAGRWRRDFASRGITLGQADCLVAAAAVGVGATIATGDRSGFLMPGVEVEHWPVG